MSDARFAILLRFLGHLDEHKVPYQLVHSRPDALMVQVATPGKRWELEFMDEDWPELVQVEQFKSDGVIGAAEAVEILLRELEVPSLTFL